MAHPHVLLAVLAALLLASTVRAVDTVGSDPIGADVVGSDPIGSDITGSDALGRSSSATSPSPSAGLPSASSSSVQPDVTEAEALGFIKTLVKLLDASGLILPAVSQDSAWEAAVQLAPAVNRGDTAGVLWQLGDGLVRLAAASRDSNDVMLAMVTEDTVRELVADNLGHMFQAASDVVTGNGSINAVVDNAAAALGAAGLDPTPLLPTDAATSSDPYGQLVSSIAAASPAGDSWSVTGVPVLAPAVALQANDTAGNGSEWGAMNVTSMFGRNNTTANANDWTASAVLPGAAISSGNAIAANFSAANASEADAMLQNGTLTGSITSSTDEFSSAVDAEFDPSAGWAPTHSELMNTWFDWFDMGVAAAAGAQAPQGVTTPTAAATGGSRRMLRARS